MLVYLYHALVFGRNHYGLLIMSVLSTVITEATTDAIPAVYQKGERFCQLVIVPVPEYEITEVSELTPTERGEGGFGSTGTDNENECSAATGTQSQLKEQVESVPEQAAAQEGAEVSEG